MAGAQDGGDVVLGPEHDIDERLPERFLVERGIGDVRAGDDQGVEPLRGKLLEHKVVATDMVFGGGASIQFLE